MTNVALTIPADSMFDATGLDKVLHVDPLVGPGTLLFTEPRLWPTAGVPTGTVPNQSGWAIDLLGAGARDLTVGNTVTTGLVERGTRGTLHVAFKRGAGTGNETFVLQNQAIRDYIAANPTHSYFLAVSMRPTRIPHGSWVPSPSMRILGCSQASDDSLNLRVNATRTVVAGHPTSATYRTFAQNLTISDDSAAAAGVAIAAFSRVLGTPAASPSLLVFHNGGATSPGMSFKVYFAMIEDLTVSGRTAEQVAALVNAKHAAQLAEGGAYRGDLVTDPYSL